MPQTVPSAPIPMSRSSPGISTQRSFSRRNTLPFSPVTHGVPSGVTSIRNEYFGASGKTHDHPSVRLREALVRFSDTWATVTTTNSRITAESLVRRGVVPADRLRVIPNMVADDAFAPADPAARRELRGGLGCDENAFVWINVARLFRQKDHAMLLDAFALYAKSFPADELWIGGGGELLNSLSKKAAETGIATRVRFLGERDDVSLLLRAADAFVLSSRWEGLPNVLLEAGAAGFPVVSTDVGGVRETLPESAHRHLVEAGDSESLARSMAHVRESAGGSDGERNRDHVRRHFSRTAVLDRWTALFEEQMRSHIATP
ncbi:MAG: N-acetyl-alpha-D-glucosaminyl L-malate synthase [Calditrichaeota bacterium]|nr:N-acetyl-alpha-D-glucosaminyl L-malate synthase [Calditrichota bacterium]